MPRNCTLRPPSSVCTLQTCKKLSLVAYDDAIIDHQELTSPLESECKVPDLIWLLEEKVESARSVYFFDIVTSHFRFCKSADQAQPVASQISPGEITNGKPQFLAVVEHDILKTADASRVLAVVNELSHLIYHGPKNNTAMSKIARTEFSSWYNKEATDTEGNI